jgi:hypothetical protein
MAPTRRRHAAWLTAVTLLIAGCFGDPSFSVATRNQSGQPLILVLRESPGGSERAALLPEGEAGWLPFGLPGTRGDLIIMNDSCQEVGEAHIGSDSVSLVIGQDMSIGRGEVVLRSDELLEETTQCLDRP